MKQFTKYFAILVSTLYFALGIIILISHRFAYLSKEVRVIFAVFLFLYGGFRLARLWTKYRDEQNEDE
jgi:uncharacterized membrane protein